MNKWKVNKNWKWMKMQIDLKVMPRVRKADSAEADTESIDVISLPASPGNRIREPVQARAAPAEGTVLRLPRSG